MSNMEKQIEAVVIDDLKDILECKIKSDEVLVKVIVENKSSIIIPDNAFAKNSGGLVNTTFEIVKIGKAVKDYIVGDVLVDFNDSAANYYNYKGVGYLTIGSYSIKLATPASNVETE